MRGKREMLVVADNVDLFTYKRIFNMCKELYPRRKSFTYSLVGGKYFLKYNLSVSELAHLNFEYCTKFGLVRR